MLGLSEMTSCRRLTILAYFGEHRSQPCGNCDNCIDPPQTWDGTTLAQKAISCAYRTGQRFGTNYLVNVLMGKDDERIRQNNHNQLALFGLGAENTIADWRNIFRQLITQGYLYADSESYGALKLTDQCRPILRNETKFELRKTRQTEKLSKQISEKNTLQSVDEPLFVALRSLRKELAEKQGVPAYVIFHDQTLMAMAQYRPNTLDQMRNINGVGEQKLSRYGQAFLNIIQQHTTLN
jgi:ATP-dependent DNA helicase RecQ